MLKNMLTRVKFLAATEGILQVGDDEFIVIALCPEVGLCK